MDISFCLDYIYPGAEYRGVFENQTEEEYNNIEWQDSRTKPTWAEIVITDLTLLKLEKYDWLTKKHEEVLAEGCMTQFGFRVDCKVKDIANWTAALKLLDLISVKIKSSYDILISLGMTSQEAFIIICQNFYTSDLYLQIEVSWTFTMFVDFMIANYTVNVGDFFNSSPPHVLPYVQFQLMCLEVGSYYQNLYDHKWEVRNNITNATSLEQLNNISW